MLGIRRVLTFVAVQSTGIRALSTLQGFRTDGLGGNGISLVPKDENYREGGRVDARLGDNADGWASLMPMLIWRRPSSCCLLGSEANRSERRLRDAWLE